MSPKAPERDYSGTPLTKKLGIHDESRVLITAEGDRQRPDGRYDVIVFFAQTRAAVAQRFPTLATHLEPNGRFWIGHPKKTAGIDTDLDGNVLRDLILPSGLVDNKGAAIDERWTALQFVVRLKDRPKA